MADTLSETRSVTVRALACERGRARVPVDVTVTRDAGRLLRGVVAADGSTSVLLTVAAGAACAAAGVDWPCNVGFTVGVSGADRDQALDAAVVVGVAALLTGRDVDQGCVIAGAVTHDGALAAPRVPVVVPHGVRLVVPGGTEIVAATHPAADGLVAVRFHVARTVRDLIDLCTYDPEDSF